MDISLHRVRCQVPEIRSFLMPSFDAELVKWDGPAAWYFVEVPAPHAPDFTGAFGRAPVIAVVDGRTWSTSVWRGGDGRWLLPVPRKIRRDKEDGDLVEVSVTLDTGRV